MDNKNQRIIKSTCRMCHGVCQVKVYLENDRVVKVTGDKDSIISKGYICPKGKASVELLYHPERLKYPMRRTGEKGDNKWARISWDEALDEMSEKFSSIQKENGPEYLSILHGTTRPYSDLAARFANAFGTPNYSHVGHICYVPRVMASIFTSGKSQLPMPDLYGFGGKKPACIMIWGSNTAGIGAAHGMPGVVVKQALKSADKVIVIDPKQTRTAKRADLWLQIRPGTDGALALAMIHVMIKENIYDHNFVNRFTIGLDQLTRHTSPFTPEWAQKITRINADVIRQAARMYAATSPASIVWGNAIDMSACSFHTARSLMFLRGLTGNLDVRGGDIFPIPPEDISLKSQFMNKEITGMLLFPFEKYHRVLDTKYESFNRLPLRMKMMAWFLKVVGRIKPQYYPHILKRSANGIAARQFKLISKLKSSKYPLSPMVHQPSLWESIDTGIPYRIKAMWILGTNPLVSQPNTHVIKRALNKIDYTVVSELFMTPTAQYADLVLPVSMWLEQDDIVNNFKQWCVLSRKKIAQIGETMDDREVMIRLAKKLQMNQSFPWEKWQDFLDQMLKKTGMDFNQFCDKGNLTGNMVYEKYTNEGFPTPSGKFEFYSKDLDDMGISPLPIYREPPVSPVSTPDLSKKYPLILSAGNKTLHYFHTEGRQLASLREKQPEPLVEIHPATAKNYGIQNGASVIIETPDGQVRMDAKWSDSIEKDVVMAPYGWWFPEKNPPDYNYQQSSINQLFGELECDPDTGSHSLRSSLCRISSTSHLKKTLAV